MNDASMSALGLSSEEGPTAADPTVAGRHRSFAGATASGSAGVRVSNEVVDAAAYGAAFTVGLLEGAWDAIVDLFEGAADMIELVAKTAYQLVIGNPGAVKAMLMSWVAKLEVAWSNRDKLADDFMQKWESDDAWTRGNFQGEVLGWVMMTALLIMATSGASSLAAATGRWASVLRVLSTIDALGDVTTYVAKLGRLPGKVTETLRDRFARKPSNIEESTGELSGSLGQARKTDDAQILRSEFASEAQYSFRRSKKLRSLEAVSLKRLRLVLRQGWGEAR